MQVAPAWPGPGPARAANPRNGAASCARARAGECGLPTPAARRGSGRSWVAPSKLLRNPHAMTRGNADRHLELRAPPGDKIRWSDSNSCRSGDSLHDPSATTMFSKMVSEWSFHRTEVSVSEYQRDALR